MAVLKDLIVHGNSRFINGAQFDSLGANKISAEEGIFNKLVATNLEATEASITNLTATNAKVMGLLDVQGEMHTKSWTNANISNVGGSFYISPTVSTVIAANNTPMSITVGGSTNARTFQVSGGAFATDAVKIYNGSTTSTASWAVGSHVMVTGNIRSGTTGVDYPLGTLTGYLTGALTASGFTVGEISSPALETILGELGTSNLKSYEIKISMFEIGPKTSIKPVGIMMTSYGVDKSTYIDIYGGVNVKNSSNVTVPNVRIGFLGGLAAYKDSAGNTRTPVGWGIYTDNGYFKGVIVADSGSIGKFTIDANSIKTGTIAAINGILISPNNTTSYNINGAPRANLRLAIGRYFGVDNDGVIYASGANITNINGANITAGTVSATQIATNAITADKIQAGAIQLGKIPTEVQSQILNSNVKVGGRNLVWDTAGNDIETFWSNWGSPTTREMVEINDIMWLHLVTTTTQYQGLSQNSTNRGGYGEIQEGDIIVGSCLAYAATAGQTSCIGIHWLNSSGSIVSQNWATFTLTTTKKRYETPTWTVPSGAVGFNIMVGDNTTTAQELWIAQVKLEKGNKATDWTPAPEDTYTAIDGLSENVGEALNDQAETVSGLSDQMVLQNGTIAELQENVASNNNDINALNTGISSLGSQTDSLRTQVNNQGVAISKINERNTTISQYLDIRPEVGVVVGSAEGKVQIMSNKISIYATDQNVSAWFQADTMFTKKIYTNEILPRYATNFYNKDGLYTGGFSWLARSDGHLSLRIITS